MLVDTRYYYCLEWHNGFSLSCKLGPLSKYTKNLNQLEAILREKVNITLGILGPFLQNFLLLLKAYVRGNIYVFPLNDS